MCNDTPIIVVAQSGRFIAQLASSAGYPVRVADCFGDEDTLAICQQWQNLPDLHDPAQLLTVINSLSRQQTCYLVYGSGIEAVHPILDQLPEHITVIGNDAATLSALHSPAFFEQLRAKFIPFPETQFTQPSIDAGWLAKSFRGYGGTHIKPSQSAEIEGDEDIYYQHYHKGQSGSALFISDGHNVQLISINENHHLAQEDSFQFLGLSTPFQISDKQHNLLQIWISEIVALFGLVGFNNLDFIIDETGQLFVLEINARFSASVQLLDSNPLFDQHLQACQGQLLDAIAQSPVRKHLHTVYSPCQVAISEKINWPDFCHDIPKVNQIIAKGKPLCTAIVETNNDFALSQQYVEKTVLSLLDNT